ncbi:membrane dipeptidase [Novosphingobium sp. SG720]|uniref:dipeptidase n=1 Tax=Novosphingobium sp. SG720 TaxID=2586998 RepID=UPI0014474113|nr:membrane dipeptidase [Novosphingobium sp. SG720]NKJ42165.1 microsomal dipeptidase-like Zn-dependent dipeptidase [Novosphingobium sp. SG720]
MPKPIRAALGSLLAMAILAPVHASPVAVARVHAGALPIDAHLDLPDTFDPGRADASGQGQFSLAQARQGGLKGAVIAVFVPQGDDSPAAQAAATAGALRKHTIIDALASSYPDRAARALTPTDFRRIAKSGRLAVIESVVNGGAFVRDADDVDPWVRRGVRVFGFVHAGHNALADSSRPALVRGEGVSRWGGLSPAGKRVLARLNQLGVLVDVSQLSDAAFADVLALSTAPVVATHSDLRSLVDNTRNLTDAQLDALKAKGGVIAINAFSAYLRPRDPAFAQRIVALQQEFGIADGKATLPPEKAAEYDRRYHALRAEEPRASVKDLVDAVDHAVRRIGIDHVALSSDFNHGGGIVGWEDESQAQAVTAELVRRGYKPTAIAKLWSGNFLRVWQAAEARRTTPR